MRKLVERMPDPVFIAARAAYRTIRGLFHSLFWICLLPVRKLASRGTGLPSVGIMTVFLPGENLLFLEEWVVYHHLKGVDHFFLYDNTGSTRRAANIDFLNPYLRYGEVNKYGVPYDEIAVLSEEESEEVISRIRGKVPGVQIIRWNPRDESGQIVYAQEKAQSDALVRFRDVVDWMIFIDMDEFLVSNERIPEICHWLESKGLDGGRMADRVMSSRYDHIDSFAVENRMAYLKPYPVGPKYVCHTRRVTRSRVHSFQSRGRQIVFDAERLHFLHYKMPSLHPDMSGSFAPVDTGINPHLLDGCKDRLRDGGGPEWRLAHVNPGWRSLMTEVDPSWHLHRAGERLADRRYAHVHGARIAAVARELLRRANTGSSRSHDARSDTR